MFPMADGHSAYKAQERKERLEYALGLPLADAVCWIAVYNIWRRSLGPAPHPEPITLGELSSKGSPEDLEHWAGAARRLIDDGIVVADAITRDHAHADFILAAYRARHPGFSSATYDEALSYGQFLAIF